jgi:HEAT repeat protein
VTLGSTNARGTETNESTESLLNKTDAGQAILAYLGCIDFDCSERLSDVVALGSNAVEPLLMLLAHGVVSETDGQLTSDITVRVRSIIALGMLEDPRALNPLIAALKDPNPLVRAEVVTALGRFSGEDAALTTLLHMLGDPDPLVREMTVGALEALGNKEALSALRSAAQNEPADYIRRAINKAIETLEKAT